MSDLFSLGIRGRLGADPAAVNALGSRVTELLIFARACSSDLSGKGPSLKFSKFVCCMKTVNVPALPQVP